MDNFSVICYNKFIWGITAKPPKSLEKTGFSVLVIALKGLNNKEEKTKWLEK